MCFECPLCSTPWPTNKDICRTFEILGHDFLEFAIFLSTIVKGQATTFLFYLQLQVVKVSFEKLGPHMNKISALSVSHDIQILKM